MMRDLVKAKQPIYIRRPPIRLWWFTLLCCAHVHVTCTCIPTPTLQMQMNFLGWRSPLALLNSGTLPVHTPLVFQVGGVACTAWPFPEAASV